MNQAGKIPGPPNRWFGLGHLGPIQHDFRQFSHDLWREYGDVATYRVLWQPVFQFAHPDDIHELLVAKARSFHKPLNQKRVFGRVLGNVSFISDGEFWTRRRRLLGPLFQPHVVDAYRSSVIRQAEAVFSSLGPGETNIAHAMSDVALLSAAEALFGSTVLDAADEFRRWTAVQQEIVARQIASIFLPPRWAPTRDNRTLRKAERFFIGLVDRLIEQRRADQKQGRNRRHNDLLDALLNAVDTEDGARLSDHDVRAESLTMLLAGNDTTAAALNWSGYLLAKHPQVQEQLHDEVSAALVDGRLAPESAMKIPLAEQVFQEAMRLYPPATAIARHAIADVHIGATRVPRGALAFALVYTLHRDPRRFAEPEAFRPERFSPQRQGEVSERAYLPFGAGPRACIGKRFAMMEGPLVLAELVRRCRFRLADSQGEPELETQLSLHPRGGLQLFLSPREQPAPHLETTGR